MPNHRTIISRVLNGVISIKKGAKKLKNANKSTLTLFDISCLQCRKPFLKCEILCTDEHEWGTYSTTTKLASNSIKNT